MKANLAQSLVETNSSNSIGDNTTFNNQNALLQLIVVVHLLHRNEFMRCS